MIVTTESGILIQKKIKRALLMRMTNRKNIESSSLCHCQGREQIFMRERESIRVNKLVLSPGASHHVPAT